MYIPVIISTSHFLFSQCLPAELEGKSAYHLLLFFNEIYSYLRGPKNCCSYT